MMFANQLNMGEAKHNQERWFSGRKPVSGIMLLAPSGLPTNHCQTAQNQQY